MVKINGSQGQLQGKGLAIAGMVTGGLGIFVGLVWMAIALPALAQARGKAKLVSQKLEMNVLFINCRAYALDHDGHFPADLSELHPKYLDDDSLLKTYGEDGGKGADYIYFSGYRNDSPTNTKPLIASPTTIIGGRVILLVGGEVVEVPEEEFQRLMKILKSIQ